MISHDTMPFRAILAIAGQRQNVDAERCRVVLELMATAVSVRNVFRNELGTASLSELDFATLVTLYAVFPGRTTLANVAAQTGSTRPSMTEAADRLEARSLLRRERDTDDRRVVFVRLTDSGRSVTEQSLDRMVEKAVRISRGLNGRANSAVVEACRRLGDAARRERPAK